MPTTHEELIQKYIAGCLSHDKESQYALFKHFHSYAMGICRRYARNSDEASDILSESFLKVFNHITKYDTTKPFKSWISKIITNTAIDYYRASLRFSPQEYVENHEDKGNEADIYSKLAYDDLLVLVRELSPAYQTVFNLYAIDGYNHHEIADLLGITVGTSKANLHKARKKLQERLQEYVRTTATQVNKGQEDVSKR
ncbi:RNA polymerase sigma factor [Parapedobacter tibetensis]|uniref:RNA polymerase sigma factor n=1 Tax=Parapedobacter tibetensis TaxID=2972951 RepID=UPI00214D48C0|nr:RNA polymerase sigma factor [Parapedobacter tibetensis]